MGSARFRSLLEYDEFSSYPDPRDHSIELAQKPTAQLIKQTISVGTTEETFDLSAFATITGIIIENLDGNNFVIAEWMTQIGSQGADDFDFAANDTPETILDNSGNTTFLTNYATTGGYVRIAASENTGENDGLYLIQNAVDGDNLTIATGTALLADNDQDTAATLSFEEKCRVKIPKDNMPLIYMGNVVVASDLKLEADTAACRVSISIIGT